MKKIITIIALVLVGTHLFGQEKLKAEAKDYFWGDNDAYSKIMDVPDKWKDESAVILFKNVNYDFHFSSFGKKITYRSSVRLRIKLLDKNAVEEFSEFSFTKNFNSSKGNFGFSRTKMVMGLKIVKPDGKEREIDVDKEAIFEDNNVKLALSNLEIDDVLDFYYHKVESFKSTVGFAFDPVESTLNSKYPIVDFKLFFETEKNFYVTFQSFQGAPELKKVPVDNRKIRRFEMTAHDLDRNDYTRWSYPLVEFPTYKFQVYFAKTRRDIKNAKQFLPEDDRTILSSVTEEDILAYYKKTFLIKANNLSNVSKYGVDKKDLKTKRQKAEAAYYYYRFQYFSYYTEASILKKYDIDKNAFVRYPYGSFFESQLEFIEAYAGYLKKSKIPYKLILGKKRYDGSIDDILLTSNLQVFIEVELDEPLYISYFGMHTNAGTLSPYLEGTDGYQIVLKKHKPVGLKKMKIPASNYQDNKLIDKIDVTLNEDMSSWDLKSNVSYYGHLKSASQSNHIIFSDYVYNDYEKFEAKRHLDLISGMGFKKMRKKVKKETDALILELEEKRNDAFEESAKTDLDLEEIDDYSVSILNDGRYGKKSPFSYEESFIVKDKWVKKAGPNYIVEIGKLIGEQVEIKDKERKRETNIHMTFPKSIIYEISFKIPEGYSVSGLDKLKKNVSNETGGFVSTAEVKGNVLTISTRKIYKHNYESVANWPKMLAFLDEAWQFTNEKILLKKK